MGSIPAIRTKHSTNPSHHQVFSVCTLFSSLAAKNPRCRGCCDYN